MASMNVLENWQKGARMMSYIFMFRAVFKNTYSEFQMVSRSGFDCYSFTGYQAREQCCDFGLNWPPMLFLISHFSSLFFKVVWPFLQSFMRVLGLCGLCAYNGMNLGQNMGYNPSALKMEDWILITINKFPNIGQILFFLCLF